MYSVYRHISTFALVFALTTTVSAQWRQLEGPYGGTIVSSLAMLPDGSSLAATAGGLFRSVDDGQTWSRDADGVDVSGIDARALLVLDDGRVVAATFGGGVYFRDIGSSRWQDSGTWGQFSTSLTEAPDGALYAGTIEGIMRSDNRGQSWQRFAVDERAVWVQAVAATENYVFVAAREGIYRSADRGVTWEFSAMGMTTLNTTALMAAEDGTLFAGTSSILSGCRLYRSRSEGRLWTCAQPAPDPLRVGAIAQDSEGRIYVGGYRLVYVSDDGGNSWRQTSATQTTVHALATNNSTVLAGTFGRGVVRSQNRAGNWTPANEGLMSAVTDVLKADEDDLYVATIGGVFHTDDDGENWALLDDPNQPVRSARSLLMDGQGRILSGTLSGLFRYEPLDDSWELLGPPGTPAVADMTLGDDGTLYAGYYEGIYELKGNNWRSFPIIGPDQATRNVVAVGVDHIGNVYAGGSYDSFRRTAESSNWRRLTSSSTPYFEAQVFAEDGEGVLYAGTRYFGVMCSRDGGDSWIPLVSGLSGNEDIRALAFDNTGALYAGSFGSGVLRWSESRRRWEPFDSGMENVRGVTGLAFTDDGRGFAGSYGAGVFKYEVSTVATEDGEAPSEVAILRRPYPNPTNGDARMVVSHPVGADVSVAVYDLLGRRVSTETGAASVDRRTDISIPSTGLVPGLYLVRVEVTHAGGHWSHAEPLVVVR